MSKTPLANWNGQEMPLSEVRVSVLDRAFLFGDAVYEVIRVYNGKPFLFDDHFRRLKSSLQSLQIAAESERIAERALATLASSHVSDGMIYVQVTRGEAPRTHHFPHPAVTPNELIYVKELIDPYQAKRRQGGRVLLIDDLRWKRCDIKSVNLLANCLGAEQAHAAGYDEAIFVSPNGTLVEGTHTSLFGVRQGTILTAPLSQHLLPGITRRLILRLAAECGISLQEASLQRDNLHELEELFLTGTTLEILPVIQVDQLQIGAGTPGPVTQALQKAYRAVIEMECD